MRSAPIKPGEESRLAALAEYDALHDDLDPRLNEIVHLARRLFGVPIALVSLVDRQRQVFAARSGLEACETGREESFCAHALGGDEILVVRDARVDPRFFDNPLVTGPPYIRFYAGAPLRTASGHDIGTLCIIDTEPHNSLPARDRNSLRDLAALVVDQLELRRLHVAGRVGPRRFQNIAVTSPDSIVCTDRDGRITFWNDTATALFGYGEQEALGSDVDIIMPEEQRGSHRRAMQHVANGGEPRLVGKTIELEGRHKSGRTMPIELSLSMWKEDGQASFGAIMRDITNRRAVHDHLYRLAHEDYLTALPNRGVLLERLGQAVEQGDGFSLLRIAVDSPASLGDALVQADADALLKQIGGRLLACLAPLDTLARLNGDEFAVLVPAASPSIAEDLADRLGAAVRVPLAIGGSVMQASVSVGIARYPAGGDTGEDLLSNAGLALYQARGEGPGCRRVFTPELRVVAVQRRALEGELHRAVERQEFRLFFQPQVDLATGALTGGEALIRWQHPTRGLLAPSVFLPAIEKEGGALAREVGRWTLETACAQAAAWCDGIPGFRIGVNLFAAQLQGEYLPGEVQGVLRASGLAPAALELEVTEKMILHDQDGMRHALGTLRAIGTSIALDDFGTGPASLNLLKVCPLNRLKIDGGLVSRLEVDLADALIISAAAMLGAGLNLDVIAEGVETERQRDLLRAAGCTGGQGYLFGRPMPAGAFADLVEGAAYQPARWRA